MSRHSVCTLVFLRLRRPSANVLPRKAILVKYLLDSQNLGIAMVSTFTLPNSEPSVSINLSADLSEDQLLSFIRLGLGYQP